MCIYIICIIGSFITWQRHVSVLVVGIRKVGWTAVLKIFRLFPVYVVVVGKANVIFVLQVTRVVLANECVYKIYIIFYSWRPAVVCAVSKILLNWECMLRFTTLQEYKAYVFFLIYLCSLLACWRASRCFRLFVQHFSKKHSPKRTMKCVAFHAAKFLKIIKQQPARTLSTVRETLLLIQHAIKVVGKSISNHVILET